MKAKLLSGNTIICEELNLMTDERVPSATLCRMIMERYPERGQEKLEVYRGDTLAFTVHCVASWAKKTIREDTSGLVITNYNPPAIKQDAKKEATITDTDEDMTLPAPIIDATPANAASITATP